MAKNEQVERKLLYLFKYSSGRTWKIMKFGLQQPILYSLSHKIKDQKPHQFYYQKNISCYNLWESLFCKYRPNFCCLGITPFKKNPLSLFFLKKISTLFNFPSLKLHNQYCHTGYFSMDEWIGKKSVLVPDIYGTINPDIFHVYVPQSSFKAKYSKVTWWKMSSYGFSSILPTLRGHSVLKLQSTFIKVRSWDFYALSICTWFFRNQVWKIKFD